MSPRWGFGCLVYPVFYKHVAPLGLKTRFLSLCALCVSAVNFLLITYHELFTCRPSGALVVWCIPFSINMSPLWGFGCLVYPVFYKHVAPLGLKDPKSP